MILRRARTLVDNRPLLTTVLLVVLAISLAVGSLVGVLIAAEHPGEPVSEGLGSSDASGCATDTTQAKRQFRAMWITTVSNIDWPSSQGLDEATIKAEYISWLDVAVANNFNAVVVMVRIAGDTIWPSDSEPWSQVLTGVRGQDPGWDPLAFAIEETHKRGLEFHAWYNPYRGSTSASDGGAGGDLNQLAEGHALREHPEWAVTYPATGSSSRVYFNPGIPEARTFVEDAMLEVVERYDIDGVHFDDFFYPYPVSGEDFADDATFATYGTGFADKAAWRRNNIDTMIQEMYQRIHEVKPWVQFGVSPFGIWRNASVDALGSNTAGNSSYTANFADTKKWIEEGWLDYIAPQLYWTVGFAKADYAILVDWWSKVVDGTGVRLYVGQAAYREGTSDTGWDNPAELANHLTLNQQYPQVTGDIYFSANDVAEDRIGSMTQLVSEHYSSPALTPLARQAEGDSTGGTQPTITEAKQETSTGAVTLAWTDPERDATGSEQVKLYVVYRFDGADTPSRCDFADGTHLIATVADRSFTDATAVAGRRYTYVVSSIDRLGRESDLSAAHTVGQDTSPSVVASVDASTSLDPSVSQ